MNAKNESAIKFPKIVDQADWQKARDALLFCFSRNVTNRLLE